MTQVLRSILILITLLGYTVPVAAEEYYPQPVGVQPTASATQLSDNRGVSGYPVAPAYPAPVEAAAPQPATDISQDGGYSRAAVMDFRQLNNF